MTSRIAGSFFVSYQHQRADISLHVYQHHLPRSFAPHATSSIRLVLTGVKKFKRTVSWFVIAGAAVTCLAQTPATEQTITLDSAAAARRFPHVWEQMFGSGRAVLSLRESYRTDLRKVKEATGFTYVRFHAILDDENGVYDEDQSGKPVYNFSYVDQIYDGLLENHVKPFVELSFMPRKLAANLKPHPFWYKPLPSPPKDPPSGLP